MFGMVEYLGIDVRHQINQNKRKKEETRGEDWYHPEDKRGPHEDRYQQRSADGSGARKSGDFKALGMAPKQRELFRRHSASAARRKPSVSLSLFPETNSLEIEHEFACAATCFRAPAVWTGQWKDQKGEAGKRQVWEATSWKKVR